MTALLDVNALVALAWDSHIHHGAIRRWFAAQAAAGWATCPVSESGFVRVSSNPKALPHALSVTDARTVLAGLRAAAGHTFFVDDVSLTDADIPSLAGFRQVSDAHLLALAVRRGARLVTFDRGVVAMAAGPSQVELLTA